MTPTPEQEARRQMDRGLEAVGWVVQDRPEMNLSAGPGEAVREFKVASGHGFADYLLFVHRKAVGVLAAKPVGYTLGSVEFQGGLVREWPSRRLQPAPVPVPLHRRRGFGDPGAPPPAGNTRRQAYRQELK